MPLKFFMLLHKDALFSIYFGDKREAIIPDELRHVTAETLLEDPRIERACSLLGVQQLVFLKQVHGIDGVTIKQPQDALCYPPFQHQGDYLITSADHIAIGVITADCVPIVIFDPEHRIVAAIHAGWRGTVSGIVATVIADLQEQFESNPARLKVFLGPSIKSCCYRVDEDFMTKAVDSHIDQRLFFRRKGAWYFDLPQCNKRMLASCGVLLDNICSYYNLCTMCHKRFCSYRREQGMPLRQMTIVAMG